MQTTQINFLSKSLRAAVFFGGLCSGLLVIQPLASAQPANILVNNPSLDTTKCKTQSETAMVVVPPVPPETESKVIVAFNDAGARTDCTFGSTNNHGIGYSVSNNGGANFIDTNMALPMPTSTPLPSVYGDFADPVLAHDAKSGTVYLATLAKNASGIQVFRSFDKGASFQLPVNGATGFNIGDVFDKEWITVDNSSQPGLGQGNVYLVFQKFTSSGAQPGGVYITKSINGGAEWSSPTLISEDNIKPGAFVTVGTDHSVYVFWFSYKSNQIKMRKASQDLKFLDPPNSTSITVATLKNQIPTSSPEVIFPQAAVNPTNGDIYVVFNDATEVPGDKGDIFFTRSIDGGITWCPLGTTTNGKASPCPPYKVNIEVGASKTTNDQWNPVLAVTPDGRHLFISFYDRRLDPNNSNIDRYGVIGDINSSNATVTFRPNFRITEKSFPTGTKDTSGLSLLGDYDQATADNEFFYTTWADTRSPDPLKPPQSTPDVRFAKLHVENIPPIVSISSSGYVGAYTTLVAKVTTDNSDVTKVNFYLPQCSSANLKATLSPSLPDTYSVNWDATSLSHGTTCQLIAIAYDAAGNYGYQVTMVTVDKVPPSVAIMSPFRNEIVRGTITLKASVTDNGVVAKVNFYIRQCRDADLKATLSPSLPDTYTANWDTTSLSNGTTCQLSALAYDAAENYGYSYPAITVIVDNR